jgi:hypothetical protein
MHVYEECLPSTPFPEAEEGEGLHNIGLQIQNCMATQQDFIILKLKMLLNECANGLKLLVTVYVTIFCK